MRTIMQFILVGLIMITMCICPVKAEEVTTPEKPIDIDEIVTTEHTIYELREVRNPSDGELLIRARVTGSYYVDYNPNTGTSTTRDCTFTYTYLVKKNSCAILSTYITYYTTSVRLNFNVKYLNGSNYITDTFYLYV